jgi:acyl carrier protein
MVGGAIQPQQATTAALRQDAGKSAAQPGVVSSEAPLITELRAFLRTKLPEYMVPAAFVLVDELPLTANGKADRKALLARGAGQQSSAAYVAPASDLERQIVAVVQEVLHVERVGVHDNFFELGANSIELVQAHRKLQTIVDRELPIVDMFKYPTVSALAQYLDRPHQDDAAIESGQSRGRSRREALRQRSPVRDRDRSVAAVEERQDG